MPNAPDPLVQAAFVAPTSEITRRIEIYESDAATPWKPELWDSILVSGSVSANYGDAERRTFECTLDNSDGELDPEAGGLWYDKVFKMYYGIKLNQKAREPRILVIDETGAPGQFLALKSMLAKVGIKTVHYNPIAEFYSDVEAFDILVSISATTTAKVALLTEAFNKGKSILTFAGQDTSATLPAVLGTTGSVVTTPTGSAAMVQNDLTHETMQGWVPWRTVISSYRKVLTPASGGTVLAYIHDDTNGLSPGILANNVFGGARWIHMLQYKFKLEDFDASDQEFYDSCAAFLGRAFRWLDTYIALDAWEAQIGEFLSDSIEDADEYGDLIKVTGRDYTKRVMKSKFSKATTFAATLSIEAVIQFVAANGGITKFDLPVTNKTLGKDMTWERDTERWQVMRDIAEANNFEIYFNSEGFLTMREFRDPLLTAPTLLLTTGPGGNLVSRGRKTSDGELYNHITVVGESSDNSVPIIFAEAKNENPGSPTRIGTPGEPGGIGDRVKNISSSVVTTSQQAQELATSLLAVSALEEFELNFTSVLFPWIEPGDIVEMNEPVGTYWGPARFLITSLSLPLDLGPMGGNGKRVELVQ